jgi:hypothetical protein
MVKLCFGRIRTWTFGLPDACELGAVVDELDVGLAVQDLDAAAEVGVRFFVDLQEDPLGALMSKLSETIL